MVNDSNDKEKLRKIVGLLPKENCGKCGYDNCGAFAVALVAGKASLLDCHGAIPNAREICEVLRIEVPEGAVQAVGHRGYHHGHHHGHAQGRRGHHHLKRHNY